MFQDIRLRTLIALVVCLVGLYFLIPSIVPNLPDSLKNLFMKRKIQLGLDLQGGMHLIMEVDSQKAMESTMERLANNLKESLMARKIKFRNVERTADSLISLDLSTTESRSEFEKILTEQYPDLVGDFERHHRVGEGDDFAVEPPGCLNGVAVGKGGDHLLQFLLFLLGGSDEKKVEDEKDARHHDDETDVSPGGASPCAAHCVSQADQRDSSCAVVLRQCQIPLAGSIRKRE
jgi:hypothetical protein